MARGPVAARPAPTTGRIPWWRRWRTLVLGAFLVFVLLFAGYEYLAIERIFHRAETHALQRHTDTALALARATRLFVDRYEAIAEQAAATVFGLGLAGPRLDEFLRTLQAIHPDIGVAAVARPDGVLAATSDVERGQPVDVSQRAYFQALRDGARVTVSDLLLSFVFKRPATPVAAAGRAPDGRFLGAVVIGLPVDRLQTRLTPDLGGNAYPVLVDRNGQVVVYGPRLDLPWEARDFSGLAVVQAALRGDTAAAADIRDPIAGASRLGAMVPVRGLGWAVGVLQPPDVALAPARAERRTALLAMAAAVVLALVLGLGLGLWLSAPVAALSAGVAAVARGDFAHRVTVKGPGELEDLAEDFNDMGEALQALNGELRANAARMEENLSKLEVANRSLDEALARARTDRQRLEVTFEALPDPALVVDAQGVVLLANEPARRLLGDFYRPGFALEAANRPPVTPHLIDGRPMPVEDIPVRRALHYGERTLDRRFAVVTPSGQLRHVVVSAAPITASDGRSLGAVTVLRDVTEARLLEAVKDQFIARASHELRTPLTAIRGTLRFLARALAGRSAERPEELVAIAERNVEHMVRLIDDLLDASRLQSGQVLLAREPVALPGLLDDVVQQLVPTARERHIALSASADPGLTIEADRLKVEQILTNLVGNALKFTPEGGTVVVEARAGGHDDVEIRVRDTGVGLSREHLSRVFEPFFQVGPPARRVRGLGAGLGLTIAKGLVELHGGRLWVESPGLERGATFVVLLPKRPPGSRAGR